MKKLAILTVLSTPAYSHQALPETKFFQEQISKNPATAGILDYCKLVRIESEEQCRAIFYERDEISDVKLKSATRCVEKSGLKYRVALEALAGGDNAGLISNRNPDTGFYHSYYLLNKEVEGENGRRHRHEWSDFEKMLAGEEAGDKYVKKLKDNFENFTVTASTKASITSELTAKFGNDLTPAELESKVNQEIEKMKSIAKSGPSQEQINGEYMKGYTQGYAYPEYSSVAPQKICYEGGMCYGKDGETPNYDADKRDISPSKINTPTMVKDAEGKMHEVKKEEPKPSPVKDKATEDFLTPIKNSTSTGGVEVKDSNKVASQNNSKGVSTPVTSGDFARDMNDCLTREEESYYQEIGSKTVDPNKETEEEKKARKEQELRDGFCDSNYWGASYCFLYQADLDSTKAKSEEEKKQEYDQAMADFQLTGNCDISILGKNFCDAVKYELETTPVNSDEPEVVEPWENSSINPPIEVPQDYISVDPTSINAGNPSEENPTNDND